MMRLFQRAYTVRRHGEQKIINGHAVTESIDFTVRLNVQPLSKNDLLSLPEGGRTVKRIKSFGTDKLMSADENSGKDGDMLYYGGEWYGCNSCIGWLHTPLAHYESEFVLLADQSKHKPPKIGGDTADDKPT